MNIEFTRYGAEAAGFIIAAVILMGVVAAFSRREIASAAIRILALAALVFIFLQPQAVVKGTGGVKNVVALMVDVSKSMLIKDEHERLGKAEEFVKKHLGELNRKYELKIYPFSSSSYLADSSALDLRGRMGSSTDIASAMEEVGRSLKGSVSAGILVSDGGHNASGDPVEQARLFGGPIFTLGVGSEQGAADVAVTDVKASDFAFKNTPVEIECTVKAVRMKSRVFELILKESNEIIGSRRITPAMDYYEEKIKFTHVPKKVGSFTYTAYIPPVAGEASELNNIRKFSIDVLREKLRVLFICGMPGSEYSLLRRVLKSDPSVELVSFVILRNPTNISFVPDNELSLIPFPASEIFLEKLFNFDLLIFENFTYTQFGFSPVYLENIKNYVLEKGGSFLMIGGKNSFGSGGYKNTPIEDVLPVVISPTEEFVAERFGIKADNLSHPVMILSENSQENRRLWGRMPLLDGYNKLLSVKEGASVLASEQKSGLPIIACWEKGKGRVMSVSTNTTWRWAMGSAAEGTAYSSYDRFWKRSVRWLTRADKMKLVLISLDKKTYELDDRMTVKILVSDRSYQPLSGANVELEAVLPGRRRQTVPVYQSAPGEYFADLRLEQFGSYKLTARAHDPREPAGNNFLGEDSRSVDVASISREDQTLEMNKELLEEIARVSGGYFEHIDSFSFDRMDKIIKNRGAVAVKERVRLWNNPYFFAVIVFLLISEWYIRRKRDLL